MKITIEWSEDVTYSSVVEVDEVLVREWLRDGRREIPVDHRVTAAEFRRFLEAGDEAEWFEQADTLRDLVSVDSRSLDRVQL